MSSSYGGSLNRVQSLSGMVSNASNSGSLASGSSRKRPYDDSNLSTVSKFSVATHNKLIRLYGYECWHCSAEAAIHSCHVIAQKDGSFREYRIRGFIEFDGLAHPDNGVRLCTLCHPQFDDIQRPGLIFFPHDLRYFIDFEKRDYNQRIEKARAGCTVPKRQCPTAEEYLDHQIDSGAVPETAIGGLYERFYLRNYLPKNDRNPQPLPILEPKQWHGSPVATIMRAFLIHGSVVAGIDLIPQYHRDSLRELQDLYLRPDPSITTLEEDTTGRDQPGQTVRPENSTSTNQHAQDRHGALDVGGTGTAGRFANLNNQSGSARDSANDSAIDVTTNNTTKTTNHNSRNDTEAITRRKSLKRRRTSIPEDNIPTEKRQKREKRIRYIERPIPVSWKWGPDSTSSDKANEVPWKRLWDQRKINKLNIPGTRSPAQAENVEETLKGSEVAAECRIA